MSQLPLERFTVIDLTRVRAGPTATRHFADWGAKVIMVEPKQELNDIVGVRDSSDFQNLNRNKRSITLDLKKAKGREVFLRLAKQADVLFENFRPDVKSRLGISYEDLHQINPRLVYTSISGFGQDGPYSQRPGLDQIAQGMGGLMSVTGTAASGPMRAGIAVADSSAGLYAALGALTALLEREASGVGRWVRTSLLQAQISMMDFQAARWIADGEIPERVGNDHPTAVPMGLFETADGKINLAASGTTLFERFCKVAGCEHLLTDPRFSITNRKQHREALSQEIARVIAAHPSAHWVRVLNEAGVPCGPIYNVDEVFADPQVKHLGVAQAVEHRRRGRMDLVGQPIQISGAEPRLRSAAPDPGEHTAEVLSEFGFTESELRDLAEEKVI